MTRQAYFIIVCTLILTGGAQRPLWATYIQPLLHYTFDTQDISGTTVTDHGTGGNDGTIVGTVPIVAGKFGQAASFDGAATSTFVDVGTPLLDQANAFQPYTFSFWINTASSGGIFTQYLGAPNADRFGIRNDSQGGRVSWWHGDGGFRARANTPTNDGAWRHVAFVKDAAQNLSVYTDGQLDTDLLFGPQTDLQAFTNATANVGTFTTNTVVPFDGLIDEMQVFDVALTADQIQNLFLFNTTAFIPEPSSLLLFSLGGVSLLAVRRRRRCCGRAGGQSVAASALRGGPGGPVGAAKITFLATALAILLTADAQALTLLRHYRLDEIDAGTTPDETGNSDGILNGGPTLSGTGKIGNSFSFAGSTTEFVGVADPADGRSLFTASFWMSTANVASQGPVGHWNVPSGDRTVLIRTNSGGNLQTFADQPDPGGQIGTTVAGLPPVTANVFNHVAITYDGQSLRTYLNGAEGTTIHTFAAPTVLGEGEFGTMALGGRGGSENVFSGLLDDVAFFEAQLNLAQINALINLADTPELNYDAGQANDLFRVFDEEIPDVLIEGLTWAPASGFGGSAGDVVALGTNQFFLNLDGTNGVLGLLIPEPSTFALAGVTIAGALRLRRRRRRQG